MEETSASVATYKVEPRRPIVEPIGERIRLPRGSCVVLHGWDSKGSDMAPLVAALQRLPSAVQWKFYAPSYETQLETFVQAARDLYPGIHSLAQPLILVGYSEGAVVARQLVVDGVQVKAVVTICGPHLGVGGWIPTPGAGPGSLRADSPDLRDLNASPVDQRQRHLYHFFGIWCTDLWGDHQDDGVVPIKSAVGVTLGQVAQRAKIHLDYGQHIAGFDPHLRGMDPIYLAPVLNTCAQLFT